MSTTTVVRPAADVKICVCEREDLAALAGVEGAEVRLGTAEADAKLVLAEQVAVDVASEIIRARSDF